MENRTSSYFSRARGIVVLAALALLPLVHVSACYEPFMRPKIAFGLSLAILLLLLALWRALAGERVGVQLSGVNALIGAFLLWNVLMWPLATSRSLATGRIAWVAGVVVICWAWQEWCGARRRRLLAALWCLGGAAGIVSAWALWQDLSAQWWSVLPAWVPRATLPVDRLGDWRGLISASFGNTDFIAAFLATLYLPLLLLMLYVRGAGRATLLTLVLWLASAALLVCWSVGANASLILAAGIVAAGFGRARWQALWGKRRTRLIAWGVGCACVLAWLLTDTPLNPHRPGLFQEAFASQRWREGGPTRGVIWLGALEMIRHHQLTGVGPGCFSYVFPSMQSAFVPPTPEWLRYQGAHTNAAHNTLLQTWAELGPVGAALLVALVVAAFRALAREARRSAKGKRLNGPIAWGAIGALSALCFDSMMTFPFELPPLMLLFFAFAPVGRLLSDPTRDAQGYAMPPLILEGRWGEAVVRLRGFTRIVSIAGSLDLPRVAAIAVVALSAVLGGFGIWQAWLPVRSDALYRRAHEARAQGLGVQADALYRRALATWPRHHDCRSEYSQFLLDSGRYAECIEQLNRVLERLDSRELYSRRRDAYAGLGFDIAARRDHATFLSRIPAPLLRATSAAPTP